MGSGVSSKRETCDSEDASIGDILEGYDYFLPVTGITLLEVIEAEHAWQSILGNQSSAFFRHKESNEIDAVDCLNWFYSTFYNIYCETNNISQRDLDEKKRVQIDQVSSMITSLLKMFKDGNLDGVSNSMWKVAKSHARFGVHASQYPIVCRVLLLSMEHCLEEAWTPETLKAWSKITSVMLDGLLKATTPVPFRPRLRSSSSTSILTE